MNISEEGWFGNSIGPYQHLSKSIFRAIESDSFVLRSANKGISAIINNKGQVIKALKNICLKFIFIFLLCWIIS